jgi:hypothetical protein
LGLGKGPFVFNVLHSTTYNGPTKPIYFWILLGRDKPTLRLAGAAARAGTAAGGAAAAAAVAAYAAAATVAGSIPFFSFSSFKIFFFFAFLFFAFLFLSLSFCWSVWDQGVSRATGKASSSEAFNLL